METYEKKQRLEQERNVESKEAREQELTEEAKAAATRERAEYLVKEVKSGTQQIQNIMIHTQSVLAALNALKAKLALIDTDDPRSVVEDEKLVSKLRKKISAHMSELKGMKEELIVALEREEKNDSNAGIHTKRTYEETRELVNTIIQEIEESG